MGELKRNQHYFTSECVSEGHPDKVSDAISDAVLDECLKQDPNSRVACETLVTTGQVVIAGELTTKAFVDFQKTVRETINRIGYTKGEYLFFGDGVAILNSIHSQSPDIAMGVDVGGAGDQGMMFGGAVKETKELMPLPIALSRALINKYTEEFQRKLKGAYTRLWWARPDAKSQVTVIYEDGKPIAVDTIVMSCQHDEDVRRAELKETLMFDVIVPVLEQYGLDSSGVNLHINPTGKFVIGGPHGDTGLTGRKIIVDTYGGYFSHGGGAFSGKDSTKVDRSAAYAARWVAKNIVAADLADKCEVQLSYAIGIAEPTSVLVKTFGTEKVEPCVIEEAVKEVFDLTPRGIIESLQLRNPCFSYSDLASRGHIGRTDIDLPWERLNKIEDLVKAVKEYQ